MVFENRVHSEELHNLYASSIIVMVIKTRLRWAGHVACFREGRNAYKILVRNPKGKNTWKT
jgi:hypothetical protein